MKNNSCNEIDNTKPVCNNHYRFYVTAILIFYLTYEVSKVNTKSDVL